MVEADTPLSTLEFRILDRNSPHFGVPLKALMKNAARVLAEAARKHFRPRRVLIVAGPGNNGGDGLAMAPLLADHAEVRVLLSGPASELKTPEARWAYRRLDRRRIPVEVWRGPQRFRELTIGVDLVVDALLGSGGQGDLRNPVRSLVKAINAARRPVLAVDVPTGYEGRVAVRPKLTVALHGAKEGLTRSNAGRIVVRDIGIPARAIDEVGPGDFAVPYPRNPPGSHKGENGRLLIVAGGPYTGAPILASRAAARSGIDLVRLYAPSEAATLAQEAQADLIVHPGLEPRLLVPEDNRRIRPLLAKVDALLVGPGLGHHDDTKDAVIGLLKGAVRARIPTVLDADAIAIAGGEARLVRRLRPLVTPHHGEFREFTGRRVPARLEEAKRAVVGAARRLRSTLLVKGPVDLISDGSAVKMNTTHHAAMTTGGTGDVLAGLCGGFVAKGMTLFHAARAAAFVTGDAGRRVAERQGGSLLASDLVDELPKVFRAHLGSA